MKNYDHFKGVIPPISTLFDKQGQFDKESMSKLIDQVIDSRVHGLLILGSGGEFNELNTSSRKKIAEYCVEYVNKRVPVFIGTGSNSTNEAIELTSHAKTLDADGVFIINPYYWQLTEEDLFKHYNSIAKSVDIPIFLYNFPNLTGQPISVSLVMKLVETNANIIGIKETIDSVDRISEMIQVVKAKYGYFKVFAGLDVHLANTLLMGGDGVIPGTANFAPQLTLGIYEMFQKGNLKIMADLQKKLTKLSKIYNIKSPIYISIKEAINQSSMEIPTFVQPPAQKLNKSEIKQLQEILKSVELIN